MVIVVLGDVKAHEPYEEIANADKQAGIYEQGLADYFTNAVKTGYADISRAHGEAIRSGSHASMIGFDQGKLREPFMSRSAISRSS